MVNIGCKKEMVITNVCTGGEGRQGRDGGRSYPDFLCGDLGKKISGNTKWMWVMMFERVKGRRDGRILLQHLQRLEAEFPGRICQGTSTGIHLLGSLENGADPSAATLCPWCVSLSVGMPSAPDPLLLTALISTEH